ncbi:uncharacterized protein [Musca autumnalis]|uniref:uncharacterized protein n=1 Tax=Musca autumnalis TaxID=221902 RepID=UPI003CE8E966
MGPRIPDRWLDYTPVGDRIEGTRFIAFKVPLKQQFTQDDNRFDSKILLEKVPNLGIIIDLTNTNRYYNPKSFEEEGVQHQKLMIPGHVTPPQRLVDKFKDYVKEFLQSNPDNDKLIGVHCTHGVNRTGFLICNYMVSEMAVEPNEAIEKFAAARGHKIERNNYLNALQNLTAEVNTTPTSPNQSTNDANQRKSRENTKSPRKRHHESLHRSSSRGDEQHNTYLSWRNHNNTAKRDTSRDGEQYKTYQSWRNRNNADRPPSPKRRDHQSHTNNGPPRRYLNKYERQCHRLADEGVQSFEFRGRSAMTYDNNNDNSSSGSRNPFSKQRYGYQNGPNHNYNRHNDAGGRYPNDRYNRDGYSTERPNNNRNYTRDNNGGRQRSISAGRRQQPQHTTNSHQNRR